MKHICIKINANEQKQEELIALLNDYHPSGFEQFDDRLVVYFEEPDYDESILSAILPDSQYQVIKVEQRNWNEEWEQSFRPVVVEDFCAIRAHFHSPIAGVKHEVVITPKMSFGTGHHPTTYLMVQAMREIDFTGKSVFDFGTGTGILAILAHKLGAREITAIDVDDWSVENAAENFERNGVTGASLTRSTNLPPKMFEVILANINRNVILDYMPHLVTALKPNALVLFSGLLIQDEEPIVGAATQHGMQLEQCIERQGWIALRFLKPH